MAPISSREQPNILKIGMTRRSVSQRVKEINSAKGKVRYKVKEQEQLLLFEEIEKYLTDKEGSQV